MRGRSLSQLQEEVCHGNTKWGQEGSKWKVSSQLSRPKQSRTKNCRCVYYLLLLLRCVDHIVYSILVSGNLCWHEVCLDTKVLILLSGRNNALQRTPPSRGSGDLITNPGSTIRNRTSTPTVVLHSLRLRHIPAVLGDYDSCLTFRLPCPFSGYCVLRRFIATSGAVR